VLVSTPATSDNLTTSASDEKAAAYAAARLKT